jgi:nucleoside-diphosphate-sugar epimerase
MKQRTALLTGVSGYAGGALLKALLADGWRVLGLSRRPGPPQAGYVHLACDLTDRAAVAAALQAQARPDLVLHAASRVSSRRDAGAENLRMVASLLDAVLPYEPRFILFSSVAVYGAADRPGPARPGDATRPVDAYGAGKLAAEKLLINSPLSDFRIVRVAPVYSPERQRNLAVRVFLPGAPIRLRILPPPMHSLVSLETLCARTLALANETVRGRFIENLCDETARSQAELVELFSGPEAPLYEPVLRPLYYMLRAAPGGAGRRLAEAYWKLFRSTLYEPGARLEV